MGLRTRVFGIGLAALTVFGIFGCKPKVEGTEAETAKPSSGVTLRLLSASENKTLEPILKQILERKGYGLKVEYVGSVDMMMRLQGNTEGIDAVWPASRIWLTLGDTRKQVKDDKSIHWSPIVFGIKKTVAQRLGWTNKTPVKVADILKAAESGQLRFMMTSATQSNSGASAYLGFLQAFARTADVLQSSDLQKPEVQGQVKRILSTVNRSSGSSGWLKDLFLQKYDAYDGMVNYESVIIESNQELQNSGREPLFVVYPTDGLAIADYPLGYVDHGDAKISSAFHELQAGLLEESSQKQLVALGRRVGPVGDALANSSSVVFNPEWGIDTGKFLNQLRLPKADVIREALELYQVSLRKPSYTIYCLDYSGSMSGSPEESLKSAMRMILNQDSAKRNLLQATKADTTIVIPFNHKVMDVWRVEGNDPNKLNELWGKINALDPAGGTAIYSALAKAIEIMKSDPRSTGAFPAIILLSDGMSNTGLSMRDFEQKEKSSEMESDVPVFSIKFGESDDSQLNGIAKATSGKVFDGMKDLSIAFRDAKGYN